MNEQIPRNPGDYHNEAIEQAGPMHDMPEVYQAIKENAARSNELDREDLLVQAELFSAVTRVMDQIKRDTTLRKEYPILRKADMVFRQAGREILNRVVEGIMNDKDDHAYATRALLNKNSIQAQAEAGTELQRSIVDRMIAEIKSVILNNAEEDLGNELNEMK